MQFSFTEDQELFRAALRELLSRECAPEALRGVWERGEAIPGLWAKLGEQGVLSLTASEAQGGLGLGELDWVLLFEEAGYAGLPEPLAQVTACAVPLLEELGASGLLGEWLPRLNAGAARLGVAFETEPYVAHAAELDLLLLQRRNAVYAAPQSALRLTPQTSVDRSRRVCRVDYTAEPSQRLTADASGAWANCLNRALLAQSAELVGVGQRMLDMTVEYVKVRHQFGKPIGSYQAVKHRLTDCLLKLEFARPVVYRAAYSLNHSDPATSAHVSMAQLYAARAAEFVAKSALQLHGAIGYTFEYDLQLWMKRAWALGRSLGHTEWHLARVAAHAPGLSAAYAPAAQSTGAA